jgi:hypothetical protein
MKNIGFYYVIRVYTWWDRPSKMIGARSGSQEIGSSVAFGMKG